jgi:hypothetical protein
MAEDRVVGQTLPAVACQLSSSATSDQPTLEYTSSRDLGL